MEVNNCELLYKAVSTWLHSNQSTVIHWTDGNGIKNDILFSTPLPVGGARDGLYIGIVGYKTIMLPINKELVHDSYIAEKTGYPRGFALTQLVELFTKVKELL